MRAFGAVAAIALPYRDVPVTVRDRVAKLKKAGRTEKDVIAAIVYNTL